MPRFDDTLASEVWADHLAAELADDTRWRADARWFCGSIELRHDTGSITVRSTDCAPPQVTLGPLPRGSDIVIEADDESWAQLLAGEIEFLSGGPLGKVALRGDLVRAMHELRTIHNTLLAMRRLVGTPRPAPSPEPLSFTVDVHGRYVDVDGTPTYVEEAGGGTPLICLHTAGQDTLMYRHVLAGLADWFRVMAIDAPGHGKSLLSPDGPFTSITAHAAFNERLFDFLALDRPVLLGCSMAGNMVLELAARRPDAYRAIVSAEGAAHTLPSNPSPSTCSRPTDPSWSSRSPCRSPGAARHLTVPKRSSGSSCARRPR